MHSCDRPMIFLLTKWLTLIIYSMCTFYTAGISTGKITLRVSCITICCSDLPVIQTCNTLVSNPAEM
uniref:Uncharacterized protein n=1 Tax=Anguilla anguilla TaxID=7936 RepID=A0A0E9PSQ6_ANGAN